MTFMDSENSARGSRPVECYDVVAGTTTVRFCNQPVGITHLGNFYQATRAVERKKLTREGVGGNSSEMEVSVERSILAAYVPGAPEPFTIDITRVQPGGYQHVFGGLICNTKVSGQIAKLLCVRRLEAYMKRRLPALVLSQKCQRVLYDKWCRVARSDFDQAAMVVDVDGLEVEVSTVGGHIDGWFTGGELWLGTEKRLITTQVGVILTINYPFAATLTGAVTLYAGCSKHILTCRDKFFPSGGAPGPRGNVDNFQGAPQWKHQNPHVIPLDGIAISSS